MVGLLSSELSRIYRVRVCGVSKFYGMPVEVAAILAAHWLCSERSHYGPGVTTLKEHTNAKTSSP